MRMNKTESWTVITDHVLMHIKSNDLEKDSGIADATWGNCHRKSARARSHVDWTDHVTKWYYSMSCACWTLVDCRTWTPSKIWPILQLGEHIKQAANIKSKMLFERAAMGSWATFTWCMINRSEVGSSWLSLIQTHINTSSSSEVVKLSIRRIVSKKQMTTNEHIIE